MSVLTIAQNVARRAGFTSPSTLVGNDDEIAVQLLATIKEETRALSDRYQWQALKKRGTFNFVNGQETYPLSTIASDFKDFVADTMWDYSARRPLIVPITAEDFEIQKNYLISSGIDKMVYILDNTLYISPTPGSTDTINFEYTTLNIYKSSVGVGKPDITVDTDTTTIREFLIELGVKLRFLVAKGLIVPGQIPNSFEYQDYEAQVQRAILSDGMGQKVLDMGTRQDAYWKASYTQDSNFPSV